jgi:hypothetical protein
MTTRPGYVWDATASEWVEIGQAAVVSPFKYQTSQPSSPATGDIWIDSDEEVPSVDSTLYYRWTKTMSGGETSLSGTDNNSLALKYTPGYESVFINGVLQVRGSDYVASTGTTVTGLTALTASDVVMVESIIAYSVGDTYTQSQISSLLDAKSPVSTTGLVLVSSSTFSAQSTVSFNNVFSSAYDNYRVTVNLTPSTAADISFRFRTSGTDNTAASYNRQIVYGGYNNTTTANGASGATAFFISYASTTSINLTNSLDVMNPNLSAISWVSGFYTANNSGGLTVNNFGTTTVFDGFTIYPTAGTITGTIKVYGYK